VAGVGALALAWTVLTMEMPWVGAGTEASITPPPAAACAADAKPADFTFTLKDKDDKPVKLADYKGKVILLDFWATWCGPCKVEIPWFIEFQEKYGAKGFQVLGVSVDDTADKLKPYVADMKMNYPVLQALSDERILDAYGPLLGIPVSVVIGRDGRICSKHTGLAAKDALENEIKALL
jgi:thiol-disulfide isomerase/thioredoxin